MSKISNHIDYIEFPASSTEELEKAKSFFNTVFGWSHTMYGNDYADTADSGVFSGINAVSPTTTTLVVIYVADLRKVYDDVKAAGGIITKEIFAFPGGRRFQFQDPTGNNLAAWSE